MTHIELNTTDREEATAVLGELFSLEIEPPAPGQRFGLRFTANPLDRLLVSRTRFRMHFHINAVEPSAETFIGYLRDGGLACRIGENDNRWLGGDVFVVLHAGSMWTSVARDSDLESVAFDSAALATVAQTLNGEPIAFIGYTPVSWRAGQLWRSTIEYAQTLASQPDLTPLVAAGAARLLAATALATFPNNAALEPTIEDRRDAHPRALRRAIEFIESEPDRPITVADIASAAYVTPRALQLAFRRHLDTTPMAYLRRVRLDRAHADLQAADPSEDTVMSIAARWGFANAGRFAAHYKHAYGKAPYVTLHGG